MEEAKKVVRGWHFLHKDGRLMPPDGRLVVPGVTLEVDGLPIPCCHGLHASRHLVDALCYAEVLRRLDGYICRVEVSGLVVETADKVCGTRRRVLWMLPPEVAYHTIRNFAFEALVSHWGRTFSTISNRAVSEPSGVSMSVFCYALSKLHNLDAAIRCLEKTVKEGGDPEELAQRFGFLLTGSWPLSLTHPDIFRPLDYTAHAAMSFCDGALYRTLQTLSVARSTNAAETLPLSDTEAGKRTVRCFERQLVAAVTQAAEKAAIRPEQRRQRA